MSTPTIITSLTSEQPSETELTDAIIMAAERHRDDIIALSRAIGNDPELAFEEHRAAARVSALLASHGFDVEVGAYGLSTAVEASYGDGELTVAFVGEYDALPEIGHACGHNIIAAAGVGAAITLREFADRLGIRVKFLGTPAEELGGGKIIMLERGAWDDVTFSIMVHGGSGGQLRALDFPFPSNERIVATFTGRAAHSAMVPHEGINAGDAITLAQVGLGLLRQQLRTSVMVGSYVVEAGYSTNVTPERGVLEIEVRALDGEDWRDASARVRNVVEGAALATGCALELSHPEAPYAPLQSDSDLARCYDEALERLGYEFVERSPDLAGASTDMGNVSQFLPVIHPMITVGTSGAYPHHPDYTAEAISGAGDRASVDGATALALTALAAVQDAGIRTRLLVEQRMRAPFGASTA